MVAEVTGRSRRIVRKAGSGGLDRLAVEARAGSANLAEAQAFMDDEKRILVFSDAGGTGRSYHADLNSEEPPPARPLPAGSGLEGRHRHPGPRRSKPHQPGTAAAVPADRHGRQGEKRFFPPSRAASTRSAPSPRASVKTGGQGLFRADDNLESVYGRAALRQLYVLLYSGKVDGCSFQAFEDANRLRLTDAAAACARTYPRSPPFSIGCSR